MKKTFKFILLSIVFLASSCASIFTPTKQNITFVGEEGAVIYDNGQRIATIRETGETNALIRKRISSKELVVKKEGFKPAVVVLHPVFNPVSCLNLLNVVFWAVDLATQKVCKWENTYVEIEMEEVK